MLVIAGFALTIASFVSNDLAINRMHIEKPVTSDHLPVVAELTLATD